MKKRSNKGNIFRMILAVALIPFTGLNAMTINVINNVTWALFKRTIFK